MERMIEINGSKFMADMAELKEITTLKIGDNVKVLKKVYDGYRTYPGVVVGFDAFKKLPTLIVAYLEIDYASVKLQMAYINAETKDTEIVQIDLHDLMFEKQDVLAKFASEIDKKKIEINDIETKRQYFIDMFGKYFEQHNTQEGASK